MEKTALNGQIPFDKMKDQIGLSLDKFKKICSSNNFMELPSISYEKGTTQISFPVPFINEPILNNTITNMKKHLENIRVHSYEPGYYALQALNSNLFKTDNILDNYKIELYGLTSNYRVDITKKGNLNQEEISLTIETFKSFFNTSAEDPEESLKKLGASIYIDRSDLDWSYIAGYEDIKKKIYESVILPLTKPDIYDAVAKSTRRVFESNRPKAILFEGGPGVGKTTIARVIAAEVNVPLIYVPVESIMSKWFGQSSQNLSKIFDACESYPSSILFLDEIDSLAGSRENNMFEATRRVLSVLLRRLDGIDCISNTITIAATNRKQDLDHALVSRFDHSINFPLPDAVERAAIFANYAIHLNQEELNSLGKISEGLSGRNIKDACEYTERRWARKLIVESLPPSAPSFKYYDNSLRLWMAE